MSETRGTGSSNLTSDRHDRIDIVESVRKKTKPPRTPSGSQLEFTWQGRGLLSGVGAKFESDIREFSEFGTPSKLLHTSFSLVEGAESELAVPVYVNEFWTARQRQANPIHEVSYRACFKPQLPRFFIERLSGAGDVVYDPFMGRGTTLVEAGLLGRIPYGCDVSPVSSCLVTPRLRIPSFSDVSARLDEIDYQLDVDFPEDLLTFYHPETLREICSLRQYLFQRQESGQFDSLDDWIRMVALNRLTGHSPGFFSVYSLPPNQAVSLKSQAKINQKRDQVPPRRLVSELIRKKSKRLLSESNDELREMVGQVGDQAVVLSQMADSTPQIADESVALVVTSPPFLDIVDYATDNWLRCWFLGVDTKGVEMTVPTKLGHWEESMTEVFRELFRIVHRGGFVAFEVGEVRKGKVKLESAVLRCGYRVGFEPGLVMINDQQFTKTANCWGIDNNSKGTNTNRIVVFSKPSEG